MSGEQLTDKTADTAEPEAESPKSSGFFRGLFRGADTKSNRHRQVGLRANAPDMARDIGGDRRARPGDTGDGDKINEA